MNLHKFSAKNIGRIMEEQVNGLTEQYNEIGQRDNDLRVFRHDVKSHLLVLQGILTKGEEKQALGYLQKMGTLFPYIVKLTFVKSYTHEELTLVSGERIPIGRTKYQGFLDAHSEHVLKNRRIG